MKAKLLLATILFVFASFIANAQENYQRRTVEERVQFTMEKVTPALSLTEEQKTKTAAAFTDYYKAMEKLREGMAEGTRPDRAQFEKLQGERDEKLKAALTAEQYKKFKDEVEQTLRPQRRQNN